MSIIQNLQVECAAEPDHPTRTHPANVQVAELIRLYRRDGLTYQAIADKLNTMGFRTQRGKRFAPMSVQRLDVIKL
jgi:hypothetical protein